MRKCVRESEWFMVFIFSLDPMGPYARSSI
jgi:hypothetical protein